MHLFLLGQCSELNFAHQLKLLILLRFNSLTAKSVLAGEKLIATYSISM